MSESSIYKVAIFQCYILGWQVKHIQSLLRNYYDTLKSIDEINEIISGNQKIISVYKEKITTGNAKIHQRVRLYGRQNNLVFKVRIDNSPNSIVVISRLISIIQNYHRISYETVASIYQYEYNSKDNIIEIIPTLEVYRYEKSNNFFQRIDNSDSAERAIDYFELRNSVFKVVYGTRNQIHISNSNNEIFLQDQWTCLKFLYFCFELQEIKSDPVINDFFKEVKDRL